MIQYASFATSRRKLPHTYAKIAPCGVDPVVQLAQPEPLTSDRLCNNNLWMVDEMQSQSPKGVLSNLGRSSYLLLVEYLERMQQTNVQAGTKDRDRDYLSNQGRRPTVSTGSRSSQRIHPNLLVVFLLVSLMFLLLEWRSYQQFVVFVGGLWSWCVVGLGAVVFLNFFSF